MICTADEDESASNISVHHEVETKFVDAAGANGSPFREDTVAYRRYFKSALPVGVKPSGGAWAGLSSIVTGIDEHPMS